MFLGPPVSTTNKTDRHAITEILLKVALVTIKQNPLLMVCLDSLSCLLAIVKGNIAPYIIELCTTCWKEDYLYMDF